MDRSELLSFDPKYTPGHGSMTVSTYRTPNSWASDMTAIDSTSTETLTIMPCFSRWSSFLLTAAAGKRDRNVAS